MNSPSERWIHPSFAILGPDGKGRNYGIQRESTQPPLPREARGELQTFALIAGEWASRRDDDGFCAFFPLADGRHWVFVRSAWLGSAAMGVVVVTHALVVTVAQAELLFRRPADLLAAVPPPSRRWRPDHVALEIGPLGPATADDQVRDAAEALGHSDLHLVAADQSAAIALIEAVTGAYEGPPLGWSTTAALPSGVGFDPAERFALIVSPAGGALLDAEAEGAAWRVWQGLFGDRSLSTARAARVLQKATWRREYRALTPERLLDAILFEALGLDGETRLDLIAFLARRVGKLDKDLAAGVRTGLAVAFQKNLSPTPELAAGEIARYLTDVWPYLDGTLPLMPAAEAVGRGLLNLLDERTVEALAHMGLAAEFRNEVVAACPTGHAPMLSGLLRGAGDLQAGENDAERRHWAGDVLAAALHAALGLQEGAVDPRLEAEAMNGIVDHGSVDARLTLFWGKAMGAHEARSLRQARTRLAHCVTADDFALLDDKVRMVAGLRRAVSLSMRSS